VQPAAALLHLTTSDRAILTRSRAAAAELDLLRRRWPLAFAATWQPECPRCPRAVHGARWYRGVVLDYLDGARHQCPSCGAITTRTSQRVALRALLDPVIRSGYLLGGNRVGKTEVGAMLIVAFSLGSEHPAVIRWARVNGLDTARIQPEPGRAWAVGQTFAAFREYLGPKLVKYLPGETAYRAWGANGESEAVLPGGGVVIGKAIEQARGSSAGKNPFEGAAIVAALFDEEPQIRFAVDSTEMRLVDSRGPVYNTMTPLSGWTPYLVSRLGWYQKGETPPPGVVLAQIHGEDNPHIDATELRRRLARQPASVQRARLRGEITTLEGRVHENWDRSIYVVPSFNPPSDWPRFGGIDFGTRVPFAHLWFALDQRADVLHVYREHYQAEWTTRQHADAIWREETCPDCRPSAEVGSERWWEWMFAANDHRIKCDTCGGTGRREPEIVIRWADPEGLDSRLTLNSEYGIATTPANKDRRGTFDSLWDRFALDAEGKPGIVIHDCCVETIREIENLVWDENRRAEFETKGDDHAHDVLRYVCHGLRRAGYGRVEDASE